jgi:hypothetical protein
MYFEKSFLLKSGLKCTGFLKLVQKRKLGNLYSCTRLTTAFPNLRGFYGHAYYGKKSCEVQNCEKLTTLTNLVKYSMVLWECH